MKKVLFAVVLAACFVTAAMAQKDRQPATAGQYAGQSQVRNDGAHQNTAGVRCAKINSYYYYSGSFDSTNSAANGLANEADVAVADSHIYQPFSVVAKGTNKHLKVTGLCINSVDFGGAGIDNPTPYEVRVKATVGSGGTLKCSGSVTSTDDPTGRVPFGFNEYTHAVKVTKCKLAGKPKKGTQYHMNVTPQCFVNSVCPSARFFETTDDSNIDHKGPATVRNMALWNSTTFGENWVNPNTVFGGTAMQSFSAGVSGKLVP